MWWLVEAIAVGDIAVRTEKKKKWEKESRYTMKKQKRWKVRIHSRFMVGD